MWNECPYDKMETTDLHLLSPSLHRSHVNVLTDTL